MKRKAFILTEILTGMMLQTLFALTLCGAFYLILTFSTSTQQILAARDEGQMVISFIDNRIRNAGVGLHECGSPAGVAAAFYIPTNMTILKDGYGNALPLPVAITSKIGSGKEVISKDGGIYGGNILVLLHAHRDLNTEEAVVLGPDDSPDLPVEVDSASSPKTFKFLHDGINPNFNFSFMGSSPYGNINSWAVTEASGVPIRISNSNSNNTKKILAEQSFYICAPYMPATMYPMSELLNLECQKMYAYRDSTTGGRSFMFGDINTSGRGWDTYYHTKGILELYMTLDTNANPPIFDLKVLVSEGKNSSSEITERPSNWPAAYWQDGFAQHRIHVSQASWKLYNLAPLYHHD